MMRTAGLTAARAWSLAAVALITSAGSLALAGQAIARTTIQTITSSNWSGYAAHGSGAKFDDVHGRWRVPSARCTQGDQSFSSFWVGIGGYSVSSTGLEQDGIEVDCKTDGTESVSAWYELLPAGPHTVKLPVQSGDLVSASVHVDGTEVTVTIADLTSQRSFSKTIHDTKVDDTSAEWIAEAPENCTSDTNCSVLPLADFGKLRFRDTTATTTAGVTSGISDGDWTTTRLLLGYRKQGTAFVARSGRATATPTSLTADRRSFAVTWDGTTSDTATTGTSGTTSGTGAGGAAGTGSGSGPGTGSGAGSSGSPGSQGGTGTPGAPGGGGPGGAPSGGTGGS
jgi:hypothetical protein